MNPSAAKEGAKELENHPHRTQGLSHTSSILVQALLTRLLSLPSYFETMEAADSGSFLLSTKPSGSENNLKTCCSS